MLHTYFEIRQIFKVLTFTRLWNLFILLNSYLLSILFKTPFIWANPFAITIEPITTCNLNCEECPTGKKTLTRPSGKIKIELFKKLIDQISKKTFYLNLYLQGEPFLHPEITEMITYAVSKKMFVCISTNGHFLDTDYCDKIVRSKLQKIIISLDGATEETYLKYRIGGDFNKVKNGIKNIVDTKNNLKSSTPEIIIQTLVNKYNEHEIYLLKQITKYLGANKLSLKSMQIYNNYEYLPNAKKFKRYSKNKDGNFVINKILKNNCFRLWSNAVFTFDGNIISCCYDKNAEHNFGNIINNNFNELWNNSEFNLFRFSVLKDRKKHQICKNCTE